MKYLVIEETETDCFVEEYATRQEAVMEADDRWRKMTYYDKKRAKSFYVLESVNPDEDAPDHLDGDPIKEYK